MDRLITYSEAIHDATDQEMERDPSVMVLGIGVDDPKGIYGSTLGLVEKYGPERVFDTPLAEDTMTGLAIGAAFAGMRPVHVHIRMDFLLLGMNQIVNMAAKARYMYGGAVSAPVVLRSVIGKSWGQGPQHSQGLYSLFMNIPGLKVVAPSTPYDAKGTMVQSIRDDDPVIFVEHRLLHPQKGLVPDELYSVPLGKARVLTEGSDVTIVGISYMALECARAAEYLGDVGVRAEVIDPITLNPLDMEMIARSVRKTGRLLVVENGWTNCGASAEIITRVLEWLQPDARPLVQRMGYAPVTCPTTPSLEAYYYPTAQTIASSAHKLVRGGDTSWMPEYRDAPELAAFKGPF